ncbi:L-dopachrome tautomerase yellow-f2-like [Bombyx mori]|uniref:L-dopachrome tautomerase yellow-f2-like n=1 Tax=Bombyx mori TaxID=7091 RepID=UPI002ED2BFFB
MISFENVGEVLRFLSLEVLFHGIPYTLNIMINPFSASVDSPLLSPFPNSRETQKIVSVYQLSGSACHDLIFVDTGFTDIPGNKKQVRPPRLMAFRIYTGIQLFSYEIDERMLRDGVTLALPQKNPYN